MKKLAAILSMIAVAIIVPAALFAWGPARPTYTIANPADHVTFNSITDNPVQGDERNFVQVREINASNTTYADSISLSAGHTYVVSVYYHNNAASNLNASGVGIAHGAYVMAQIPAVVDNGSAGTKAVGYVGAANATPAQVWDDVSFSNNTGSDIALRYVPGSATIHNLGATNGQTMSDSIVTGGASLGFDSLNGDLPGCNQFAGFVTFEIKAEKPGFTITKEVRVAGSTTWSHSVNAKAGDTLEYRIQYINTGTTDQNNVTISDVLPAHVSYISGSTTLKNASNPTGKSVSDNLTKDGINIGNYTSGSNAFVKFQAKVGSDISDFACGKNSLTNTAIADTNNGSKKSTAIVVISRQCTTPHELPHTGASENILAFLGLGAIVTSFGYYQASRRTALKR